MQHLHLDGNERIPVYYITSWLGTGRTLHSAQLLLGTQQILEGLMSEYTKTC